MIRAILGGKKTQSRRVVKFPKSAYDPDISWIKSMHQDGGGNWVAWSGDAPHLAEFTKRAYPTGGFPCPYGKPGDHLWVREKWFPTMYYSPCPILYAVGSPERPPMGFAWKSPIHMPRWASRINLEITSVRAERLQSISERDCCLELGAPVEWPGPGPEPYKRDMRGLFASAWDSINAKRGYGWNENPWVWVIEFKKL